MSEPFWIEYKRRITELERVNYVWRRDYAKLEAQLEVQKNLTAEYKRSAFALEAELEAELENAKHTRIAYEVLCQTGERHALDAVMKKHAELQEIER